MQQIRKSVLVLHPAQAMFDLIDGVEHYPDFLPWCSYGTVHLRNDEWTHASIGIDYLGVKSSFSTENRKIGGEIQMHLKDGPFKSLNGIWRITPLDTDACKVEFELDYEFSSKTLETLVGPVFNKITSTFVDAFVKQADRIMK
ncbi:type II toxin-antitoxin system RatA family toxin [Burkholderiaceae bacterium DAT-1]|nr:type II toxin-antitoxin system RatA family toxin [Burkholderiaceae bacterium DAT-1]